MNIFELPQALLIWSAFLGTLAAAISFFVYQIRRNDIQLLRDSIKDVTERVDFLEKENLRYKEENIRIKKDFDSAKAKKDYLKSLFVQGIALQATMDKSLITAAKLELEKK